VPLEGGGIEGADRKLGVAEETRGADHAGERSVAHGTVSVVSGYVIGPNEPYGLDAMAQISPRLLIEVERGFAWRDDFDSKIGRSRQRSAMRLHFIAALPVENADVRGLYRVARELERGVGRDGQVREAILHQLEQPRADAGLNFTMPQARCCQLHQSPVEKFVGSGMVGLQAFQEVEVFIDSQGGASWLGCHD
jgi:hypothetical protein